MVKTMASDINYERRKAVAGAWKQEKNRVVERTAATVHGTVRRRGSLCVFCEDA